MLIIPERDMMEKERKELKDYSLIDDLLMNEVVSSKKYGREFVDYFLETVIGQKIDIKEIKVQAIATPGNTEKRAIRMDIQTEASLREANIIIDSTSLDYFNDRVNDTIIDIEMQAQKKLTGYGQENDIRRRSRLYQSIIDRNMLPTSSKKGSNYGEMDNVIIIICTLFDVFGGNRLKYTFTNVCLENPKILLNDGAYRIFLNTRGTDGGSEELKELLRYIGESTDSNATNNNLRKLHTIVTDVKQSEGMRVQYMKYFEHAEIARSEGLSEGRREGRKEGKSEGIKIGEKRAAKKWRKLEVEKDAIIKSLQERLQCIQQQF